MLARSKTDFPLVLNKIKTSSLKKEPLYNLNVIQERRLRRFLAIVEEKLCYLGFFEISYNQLPEKANLPSFKKALRQASALALRHPTLLKSPNLFEVYSLVNLLITWLFHERLGYLVECHLTKVLHKNTLGQALFQKSFLRYQKQNILSFFLEEPINGFELKTVIIFYKKVNILKLVRLILKTYNPDFLKKITIQQQYMFLKHIIVFTHQNGNYSYINSLFDPLVWDPERELVKVSDIDVYLPNLGSRPPTTLSLGLNNPEFIKNSNLPYKPETKDLKLLFLRYGVISVVAVLPFLLYAHKALFSRFLFPTVTREQNNVQTTVRVVDHYDGALANSPLARSPFAVLSVNLGSKTSGYVAASQAIPASSHPAVSRINRANLNVSATLTVSELDSNRVYTTVFLPDQVSKTNLKQVLSASQQIDNIPLFVHLYKPSTKQHEYQNYSCCLKASKTEKTGKPTLELFVEGRPLTQAIYATTSLGKQSVLSNETELTMDRNSFIFYVGSSNFAENGFEQVDLTVPVNYDFDKKNQTIAALAKQHFKQMSNWIKSDPEFSSGIQNVYSAPVQKRFTTLLNLLKTDVATFNIVTSEAAHPNPAMTSVIVNNDHKRSATLFTNRKTNRLFDSAKANKIDATSFSLVEFATESLEHACKTYNNVVVEELQKIANGKSDANPIGLLVSRDFNQDFFHEARLAIATGFKDKNLFFYESLNSPLYKNVESRMFINLYTMHACKANYNIILTSLKDYLHILNLQTNSSTNVLGSSPFYLDQKNNPGDNGLDILPTGHFLQLAQELTKANTNLESCISAYSAIKKLALYNATLHSFLTNKLPTEHSLFLDKVLLFCDSLADNLQNPTVETYYTDTETCSQATKEEVDYHFLTGIKQFGLEKNSFLNSLDSIQIESDKIFYQKFKEVTLIKESYQTELKDLKERLDIEVSKIDADLAECSKEKMLLEGISLTKKELIKKEKAFLIKTEPLKKQKQNIINTILPQIEQADENLKKLAQTQTFLKGHQYHITSQIKKVRQALHLNSLQYSALVQSEGSCNTTESDSPQNIAFSSNTQNPSANSALGYELATNTLKIKKNFCNVYKEGHDLLNQDSQPHTLTAAGSQKALTTQNVSDFIQKIQSHEWCQDFLIDANDAILAYRPERKASRSKTQLLTQKLNDNWKTSQPPKQSHIEQHPANALLALPSMSQSHPKATQNLMIGVGSGLIDIHNTSRSLELSSASSAMSSASSRKNPVTSANAIMLHSQQTGSKKT